MVPEQLQSEDIVVFFDNKSANGGNPTLPLLGEPHIFAFSGMLEV